MGYKDIPEESLQHAATHCNTHTPLCICTYRWATKNPGGHFASYCNAATQIHCYICVHTVRPQGHPGGQFASHCNTLQHTATRYNTHTHNYIFVHTAGPQGHPGEHFASHCNTLQHRYTAVYVDILLGHKDIPEGSLHHTATHCNTLQHTHTTIYLYIPLGHKDIPEGSLHLRFLFWLAIINLTAVVLHLFCRLR